MGNENEMKMWISDQLMTLLGFSQPTIVQYMVGLAKQATSPADVVSKLVDFGLPSTTATSAFAEEIFSRVPRKSSGLNLYQKQEREAAILARKQKTYALLDADDDDIVEDKAGSSDKFSTGMASTPKEVENKKKRFRKKSELQDDEDDDKESALEREERQVRRRVSSSEDEGSEFEEERLRDQKEREQLERNIRERDAAGTRKLTDQKLTRREEEEAIRRSTALENDEMEALRKVSRQEYLKKREQKKLEEIRDDIEDEQYLFEGVKLTEAEYRELRYKKEIYELVKQRSDEADEINEGSLWVRDCLLGKGNYASVFLAKSRAPNFPSEKERGCLMAKIADYGSARKMSKNVKVREVIGTF